MTDSTRPPAADKAYTIAHFVEIARINRFGENGTIPHDTSRCLICHPERCGDSAFALYLEVIREAVKVRRPRLDESLVAAINSDLALLGESPSVTLGALRAGRSEALSCWRDWHRAALDTGLGLLSVHGPTSLEFSLEEAEREGWVGLITRTIEDLMAQQIAHADAPSLQYPSETSEFTK